MCGAWFELSPRDEPGWAAPRSCPQLGSSSLQPRGHCQTSTGVICQPLPRLLLMKAFKIILSHWFLVTGSQAFMSDLFWTLCLTCKDLLKSCPSKSVFLLFISFSFKVNCSCISAWMLKESQERKKHPSAAFCICWGGCRGAGGTVGSGSSGHRHQAGAPVPTPCSGHL